jgi:hypothetical protein
LGIFPEDIFIIKAMNSSFHSMFYAKTLEGLAKLIEKLVAENTEPVDPEIGIQLLLQTGRPHYEACIKNYFISGTSYFNF